MFLAKEGVRKPWQFFCPKMCARPATNSVGDLSHRQENTGTAHHLGTTTRGIHLGPAVAAVDAEGVGGPTVAKIQGKIGRVGPKTNPPTPGMSRWAGTQGQGTLKQNLFCLKNVEQDMLDEGLHLWENFKAFTFGRYPGPNKLPCPPC